MSIAERLQTVVTGRYRVLSEIGQGGMATVYLAEDIRHHRKVAIKVLQEELAHTIGIRRFLQEIEVIAGLQHPHLLTLIDSGDVDGLPFYVMPFVEGQSLRELIAREGRLSVEQATLIAREVADGLAYAHQHGIVHRDIKPSNILMSGGHAVVADFGIATALEKAAVGRLTETGISLGSPTYMSPEQAAGERGLDPRTDVYSLGCVLYEMLCGEPPIDDPSMQQVVTRKLTGRFALVRSRRPEAPSGLEAVVHRALATSREDRFLTAGAMLEALRAVDRPNRHAPPRMVIVGALGVMAVLVAAGILWQRQSRVLRATRQLPEIERLASISQFSAAFELAEQVAAVLPRDSSLAKLWPRFADFVKIVTVPAGARVYRQRLDRPEDAWELVGATPLDSVRVPRWGRDLPYRLRIEAEGYESAEVLPNLFANWAEWRGIPALDTFRLIPLSADLPGMAWIPGWSVRDTLHPGGERVLLSDYYIGRYEVTNAEYQRFVDAGGYARPEFWTEPFETGGDTLSFEKAVSRLVDQTGRPGPSTWRDGRFPEGQAALPVGGLSWFEAAAYANFAGGRLPSAVHWGRASSRHAREASWIYISSSNLAGTAPREVGAGNRPNAFGLHDIAGNVREWGANRIEGGRVTRGAAWSDPEFMVGHLVPVPPFDRSPANGMRLLRATDPDTTMAHVEYELTRARPRDYTHPVVAGDQEFEVYRRLFDYDSLPLKPARDTAGVTGSYRWEKVSFSAAYGGERMAAYIFMPREGAGPFQPVVLWPGSGAMTVRTLDQKIWVAWASFLMRDGRALVLPLFRGSFERDDSAFSQVASLPIGASGREMTVQWIKDLRRTVDYLSTRADMAADRVGFYGHSWGGQIAPLALVLEPRIKAAVLDVGGFWSYAPLAEVDPVNYVTRVRAPVLMLNGRHDVVFPYETMQLPFFRMLGTPAADKRHYVYPSSHSVPMAEIMRHTREWFDRYLGPPVQ